MKDHAVLTALLVQPLDVKFTVGEYHFEQKFGVLSCVFTLILKETLHVVAKNSLKIT